MIKKIMMFDIMTEGHGVKNWTAVIQSKAFKEYSAKHEITLVIPCALKKLLESELGSSETWGFKRIIDVEGLEDYYTWRGRFKSLGVMIENAKRYKCDSIFSMYADPVLPFFGAVKLCCPKVKIGVFIFRALIHYTSAGYKFGPEARKEKQRALFKNKLLCLYLKLSIIHRVHMQDDGAVEWFQKKGYAASWSPTCMIDDSIESIRSNDHLQKKRITLFGGLAKRKGVFTILHIWDRLDAELKTQAELHLVGKCNKQDKERIYSEINRASDASIIFEDRFVKNEEIKDIYRQSSALLLIYEGALVGTSGVLVQAAAWGVPVISTDIGWVGNTVVKKELGYVYDAANTAALLETIKKAIQEEIPFNEKEANQLAHANRPEKFGSALIKTIDEI